MTSERSGKSHATAWALAIFALPFVYLLSVMPLFQFFKSPDGPGTFMEPKWLDSYRQPYDWICANTPLARPLDAYAAFCARLST